MGHEVITFWLWTQERSSWPSREKLGENRPALDALRVLA